MADLTIIMTTANKVPEAWAKYHKEKLIEAAQGAPIITISYKPLDWGDLNLIQTEYSLVNLYQQIMRGAFLAETPYIATCDDDTLYPQEHFKIRPPDDRHPFAYNLNRWHLFSWGKPFYFHKPRPGGGLMIADKEKAFKAFHNRFEHLDMATKELPGRLCHELGTRGSLDCDEYKWWGFYTENPVVSIYHENSIDKANRMRRKKAWPVRAYDIPFWGRAEEVRAIWQP